MRDSFSSINLTTKIITPGDKLNGSSPKTI